MEKKTLESLVPPLELCQQIPEGAFADTVFEWNTHGKTDGSAELQVKASDKWRYGFYFPAPTLEEIMEALARLELCPGIDLVVNIKGEVCGSVNAACRDVSFCGGSLAAAALRLWFDVKGRG